MKKLSIVLAIIMALSCFCFTAFAAVGDECDYTALESAIGKATVITDTTKYTTDSAKAFKTAFDAAKAVKDLALKVDEAGENQKTIDEATKALNDAMAGLEEKTSATTKPATTAAPVQVNVDIVWKNLNGDEVRVYPLALEGYTVGSSISADEILKTVKARVDANGVKIIDTEEYVVSDVVVLRDVVGSDGSEFSGTVKLTRTKYDFVVYVFEINDIENLAQVAATELAGNVDWKGIASANVGLINQVIKGAQAAADSLANADYPEIGADKTAEATTKAGSVKGASVAKTPNTGASAVAGVAVVVLALSATTAVVLRKKED